MNYMPIESVMPSSHLILCCPLLLPPPTFSSGPSPSQHQSLFHWVNSSHEVAKVLESWSSYLCPLGTADEIQVSPTASHTAVDAEHSLTALPLHHKRSRCQFSGAVLPWVSKASSSFSLQCIQTLLLFLQQHAEIPPWESWTSTESLSVGFCSSLQVFPRLWPGGVWWILQLLLVSHP